MTVYTDEILTDYYIDEDTISAFVDDNGETVIIADEAFVAPGPPPSSKFYGFWGMVLWQ